ncbi:unnamed protein product [Candida verbasci]|uniref:G-protein coupled receptors family 1 profile domain-containing protein n=1 Tax=Candida verbasci TaxID=1227364 RepID=A0A9W4TWZ9_9ASCO|nr:unnamed protein product [Candida verbasci]
MMSDNNDQLSLLLNKLQIFSSSFQSFNISNATSITNQSSSRLNPLSIITSLSSNVISKIYSREYRYNDSNQIEIFTQHQAFVQRVIATSSSCTSIAAVLTAMYFFLAIDPRRLVFRHHLVFFLLFFDLLKACILLIYPTRVLTHSAAYYNRKFCQVVGYFTAVSIEGADIAILAFAVHTYLLIFKPSLNTRVRNSTRIEGGLYKFRIYVYILSFIIPLIFASLAFINGTGYTSLVCWCYLPMRPVWYRLVLSWVPRYCIVVLIFLIYGLIYIHVIKEFKSLSGLFVPHRSNQEQHNDRPTFFSSFKYFYQSVKNNILPKIIIEDETNKSHNKEEDNDDEELQSIPSIEDDLEDSTSTDFIESPLPKSPINNGSNFNEHNLENFKKRQRIIQKQMKSIFVYPFAYCFLWLFPFILQATQFNYEENNGPIYWLNVLGAFMQPFNGTVDSLVFFYRERPWKYTTMKNFEKEHKQRVDNIISNNLQHRVSEGHESIITMATSARIAKNSLSASDGLIDMSNYKTWRRILHKLKLPLYKLPSEKNVARFQEKYIRSKLFKEGHPTTNNNHNHNNHHTLSIPTDITEKYKQRQSYSAGTNQTRSNSHDYSNVLSGDGISEFKSSLGKFSFNKRANSIPLPLTRKSSTVIPLNDNRKRLSEVEDPRAKKTFQSSKDLDQEDGELDFLEFLKRGP